MTRSTIAMLLAAALAACSSESPPPAPAPKPTPAQAEAAATAPQLDAATVTELKAMLEAQGTACAEVVASRAMGESNSVELTCANGGQRSTHVLDLSAI